MMAGSIGGFRTGGEGGTVRLLAEVEGGSLGLAGVKAGKGERRVTGSRRGSGCLDAVFHQC